MAGYKQVNKLGLVTTGLVQAAPPTVTVHPLVKPEPVTVIGTVVAPAVITGDPEVATDTLVTVGVTKVATVTLSAAALSVPHFATTEAVPISSCGALQLIWVLETDGAVHARPFTVTVQPDAKLVPLTVSKVPAAVVMLAGETAVAVGAP